MGDLIDRAGPEVHIGDAASSAIKTIRAVNFPRFAEQARKDADEYAAMSRQHEERAIHFMKLAKQRISDAEFYEREIAREGQKEAAE